MNQRIIVDCDNTTGIPSLPIDDGQTLLYLFGRPDIEIVGITTTFGNGTVDQVWEATETLLDHIDRLDIPLIYGASERGDTNTLASRYLAETVAEKPGEYSILALGPLGNLLGAAQIDPAFFRKVKQIPIMGGITGPLQLGDDDLPELNLACDPEASFEVLTADCPVILMNAHICLDTPFSLDDMHRIASWDDQTQDQIRDYLIDTKRRRGVAMDYLWDVLPAVYLSYPELFHENIIPLASTVADLETGLIKSGEGNDLPHINMPTRILDLEKFNLIVDQAWANSPVSQIKK
jgi:purine nucleosidase